MNTHKLLAIMLLVCCASTSVAAPRIAVLDFELNDITSLPNVPSELQRTASMAPLLLDALKRTGDYQTIPIPMAVQKSANGGFGYLFRFPEEAAKLGEQQHADWLVVSQHSKPSFLFSQLWVCLIDVKGKTAVDSYIIELKGNHEKVTVRSIGTLAKKIQASILAHENKPAR